MEEIRIMNVTAHAGGHTQSRSWNGRDTKNISFDFEGGFYASACPFDIILSASVLLLLMPHRILVSFENLKWSKVKKVCAEEND